MDWKAKSFLILAIVLCLHSGLGHMYEVSSGSGLGSIHFNRQVQHHEDCTKGPDGKGNTNKTVNFIQSSTILFIEFMGCLNE
jgi:hypothetical protein